MKINADPQKVREVALVIRNAYRTIENETETLHKELRLLSGSLDEEAYNKISSKVSNHMKRLYEAESEVVVICKNLLEYAQVIEEAIKLES